MKQCLICKNNTRSSAYDSICLGCQSLLSHPQFSCQNCGVELQSQQSKCGACLNSALPFSRTYYACSYLKPVDKWVMALKFGGNILMSRLFAELLTPYLNRVDQEYVLMPVPLHKSRLRKRGFNQAYEIAKELAVFCNRELDTSLIRTKNTEMQAQLKLVERSKNVKNAFKTITPIKNKKIILIDDVMTTGNTLKECARTLKKAGVEDIQVIVFARKSL